MNEQMHRWKDGSREGWRDGSRASSQKGKDEVTVVQRGGGEPAEPGHGGDI